MFWGMKMKTLRSNRGTLLRHYSLLLLPESTPEIPHIKVELTEFWRENEVSVAL
jgi:hypothetical protein